MSIENPSSPPELPEWDNALQLVGLLAAARGRLSRDADVRRDELAIGQKEASRAGAPGYEDLQFARQMSDIREASAVLCAREPALEASPLHQIEPPSSAPPAVWLVVSGIWICSLVVILTGAAVLASILQ